MALFVDLDEEAEPPQSHHYGQKPEWNGERARQQLSLGVNGAKGDGDRDGGQSQSQSQSQSHPPTDRESSNPNEHNGMAEALGCYP